MLLQWSWRLYEHIERGALASSGAGGFMSISSVARFSGRYDDRGSVADQIRAINSLGFRARRREACPRASAALGCGPVRSIRGVKDWRHRKRIRPVVIGRADAVQAVVFLVSDESSFITGSEMVVDGSLTIGVPQKSEAPETIF
ncbi:hypothetical protein [Bradyrhizobium elkanii]